ncbi:MAG TPA: RNA 3'-terminal phosphate cyclase [Kofleriaceae bacterium]
MCEGLIEIDGTRGEGGGQLLRGALALAVATGRGFRIREIRKARSRPGLMRQHLTAVQAAAAICGARVEGAEIGATTLVFEPGAVRAGTYAFAIGTAGSCVLVLQAIVPALARLAAPSRISVTGGTHNPLAPTFEFLRDTLAPQLAAIGWSVEYTLVRHGFYPAGGGELVAVISPARAATRLVLVERGARLGQSARAAVAHISIQIAVRELEAVKKRLNWELGPTAVVVVEDSEGPGNFVETVVRHEHVTEVVTAIGERARSSEQVANRCADAMQRYLRATAPVGEHLLDQLLVPLAITAGGELRGTRWTPHAEAQRELLRAWFGRDVEVERGQDGVRVTVPAMVVDRA